MRRRKARRALPADLLRPPRRRHGESGRPIPDALEKLVLLAGFGLAVVALFVLRPEDPAPVTLGRVAGATLMVGGSLALLTRYYLAVQRSLFARTRLIFLVLATSLVVLLTARLAASIETWPPFGVPIVVASLLFTICLDRRTAFELTLVLFGAVTFVFIAGEPHVMPRPPAQVLSVLAPGCLVAIIFGGRIRKRSTLVKIGAVVGAAHVVALVAIHLAAGTRTSFTAPDFVGEASWAFAHGIVVGFVLTGLLPFFENTFEVVTDIRLLELSSMSHPLLQALSIRAPGTYHHSLLVGQLSEAAAEAIGANGLFCRVGAYFHDIGKILRPGFFVENGFYHEDKHLAISPGMSSLVILAHVKDGEELGRLHGLPEPIIDVIREHQGVGTIDLFYRRALEELGPKAVDKARFSYPGPRPQTLENAVVALADSTEAAYRYLSDPSPASVKKTVAKVIVRKIEEGLLEDAPLTLRQLRRIEESFVRVLLGIFHTRAARPAQPQITSSVES